MLRSKRDAKLELESWWRCCASLGLGAQPRVLKASGRAAHRFTCVFVCIANGNAILPRREVHDQLGFGEESRTRG